MYRPVQLSVAMSRAIERVQFGKLACYLTRVKADINNALDFPRFRGSVITSSGTCYLRNDCRLYSYLRRIQNAPPLSS